MKTYYGRPIGAESGPYRIPSAAGAPKVDVPPIGRNTVLKVAPAALPANDGSGGRKTAEESPPPLKPEERLLLGLVDGRLSVARLARLSGLSEEAAAHHLTDLIGYGVLAVVEPTQVTIQGQTGTPTFKLGAYEIASRVGQGGMGSVYVCRRTGASGFRRLYALKVARSQFEQDRLALQMFLREITVGKLLNHPNLQSVVDVGMYSDQSFLVLDYVEGADLEELLADGGPVPPAILVTIMLDVLRGLQRAHDLIDENGRRLGLVHADVSLSNILVGIDGVSSLADFGNARFTALGESGANDVIVAGKPAFMAPEQFRKESLDGRTDLFSLGVVFWTALTGRDLFSAETYDQIVHNVQEKDLVPPSRFGAPAALDAICMRALSRDRDARYASAELLAADLLRVAVPNGLVASSNQVGEYLSGVLGATLHERRARIEAGFRTRGPAATPTPAAGVATGPVGTGPVPTGARRKPAPTVIIPAVHAAAPTGDAAASGPVGSWSDVARAAATHKRFSLYLGLSLATIIIGLTITISDYIAKSRRRSSHAAAAAAAAAAASPPSHPPPPSQ